MANYSKQREEIKRVVQESKTHPSANEVYEIIKSQHSSASMSTVYRNLNFLCETQQIRKIYMPNGSVRFDGELQEHHHVICEKCGKLFDVKFDLDNLNKKVEEQTGVKVNTFQLTIGGICRPCQLI